MASYSLSTTCLQLKQKKRQLPQEWVITSHNGGEPHPERKKSSVHCEQDPPKNTSTTLTYTHVTNEKHLRDLMREKHTADHYF